ncbi:type II secretion system protein GspM [Stutzerimonas nosocomialis]|uniref:type II secretion system protein GspM n=1 Tax=Stutzerimonas nosocomialis TaxID=1056496 RepID=UPI001109A8D1|nr:type II secretion system protein GspM [Stutzerimonas nosocomialis]TLX54573.1 type II secretion system protein GspM [Stutzerimonas nosocomialis]
MSLDPLFSHWQGLPPARQRLLAVGWLLVALMAAYVAGRPLLNGWQDALRWRQLAIEAQALAQSRALVADDWGALGQASGVVLTEVREADGDWSVEGRLPRAGALAALVERVVAQGWRVEAWAVRRDAEGLAFTLVARPAGREPMR